MIDWIHSGPSVTAAFLGSLVECVEAVTIVLAVGTVRGWRSALLGAAGGLAVLTALIVVLGPALGVIPVAVLQLVIGLLLLLFGFSWLRKAVLRAAGIMPVRDERCAFEGATAALGGARAVTAKGWDPVALVTALKAVVLEGLEVVFIVLAVGAGSHLIVPASLGRCRGCRRRGGGRAGPPEATRRDPGEHAEVLGRSSDRELRGVLVRRRPRRCVAWRRPGHPWSRRDDSHCVTGRDRGAAICRSPHPGSRA